jgi:hypothetical protein
MRNVIPSFDQPPGRCREGVTQFAQALAGVSETTKPAAAMSARPECIDRRSTKSGFDLLRQIVGVESNIATARSHLTTASHLEAKSSSGCNRNAWFRGSVSLAQCRNIAVRFRSA